MSNLDGLSVKRNPVAYALGLLAFVGADLYRLADILVEQLFAAVNLDDAVETTLARVIVTAVGFGLGALGIQRATIPAAKFAGDA